MSSISSSRSRRRPGPVLGTGRLSSPFPCRWCRRLVARRAWAAHAGLCQACNPWGQPVPPPAPKGQGGRPAYPVAAWVARHTLAVGQVAGGEWAVVGGPAPAGQGVSRG